MIKAVLFEEIHANDQPIAEQINEAFAACEEQIRIIDLKFIGKPGVNYAALLLYEKEEPEGEKSKPLT